MRRVASLALLAIALATIASARLLPLGLPFASVRAEADVRSEVLRAIDPRLAASAGERAATDPRVDAWLRTHPNEAQRRIQDRAAEIRSHYRSDDSRDAHVYLGDFDSYLWMRLARNVVANGSSCDEIAEDACRNTLAHAPVGRDVLYPDSLHVRAIAWLHRALSSSIDASLPVSTTLLPLVVALAGAVVAFALGTWVAGPVAGFLLAVLTGTAEIFLHRSHGGDNDVWNVLLPVAIFACLLRAVTERRWRRTAVWALLAAMLMAVQGAIWDGWRFAHITLLFGLLGGAFAWATMGRASSAVTPWWRWLFVLGLYFAGSAAGFRLLGVDADYFDDIARTVVRAFSRIWQDSQVVRAKGSYRLGIFDIVQELLPVRVANLADLSQYVWFFVPSWIALPALCLSSRSTRRDLFAVFAATLVMAVLLMLPLEALGVLILASVTLIAVFVATRRTPASRGRVVLALVWPWFAAAVLFAISAQRFLLLLVAPCGIVLAIGAGMILQRVLARLPGSLAGQPAARGLVGLVFAAICLPGIWESYAWANRHQPRINDAWVRTLTELDAILPEGAIVTTWWDYGYWAQYYSRRATTMDGASLKTLMPYWTARALLSRDENEAIAILRMLGCGSAAETFSEVSQSAMGRLRRAGLDEGAATGTLEQLLRLDRRGGAALLRALGLSPDVIEAVLSASHCVPPSSALVLSSTMASAAMWKLGAWDPTRAFLIESLAELGDDGVVAALVANFGYESAAAASLVDRAAKLKHPTAVAAFVSGLEGLFSPEWIPCNTEGSEWNCPLDIPVAGGDEGFVAYRFDPRLPVTSRIVYRRRGSDGRAQEERQAVGTIWIASSDHLAPLRFRQSEHPNMAVLVDTVGQRLLLGTPRMIESVFTRLVYLDGRYSEHFRRLSNHESLGERVSAWAIDWNP